MSTIVQIDAGFWLALLISVLAYADVVLWLILLGLPASLLALAKSSSAPDWVRRNAGGLNYLVFGLYLGYLVSSPTTGLPTFDFLAPWVTAVIAWLIPLSSDADLETRLRVKPDDLHS